MYGFPGPAAQDVLDLNERYYAKTTISSRIVPHIGRGAIVTDIDGYNFIDLDCGAGVNNLGHCHPEIVEASCDQAKILGFAEHHNGPNWYGANLAMELATKSPVAMYRNEYPKVFLSSTGTETNEAALKLCRNHRLYVSKEPNRTRAIYFKNGFAGRTRGSLVATSSKPAWQRDPFWDFQDQINTKYLPYPRESHDWNELKKEFDGLNLAEYDHILMEVPVQGEGGIFPVDESALKYIYEKAKDADVIFISDCVQTGLGRVGTLFGCDIFDWFHPDILTLSKALGGGDTPIGATIFRRDLDWVESKMHSNTWGGGPKASRVALTALRVVKEIIEEGRIEKITHILDKRLRELYQYKCVEDVRGKGAMWGVEFSKTAIRDEIVKRGEELVLEEDYGLKLLSAGNEINDNVIRIMPPLIISDDLLNLAIDLLHKVIRTLA